MKREDSPFCQNFRPDPYQEDLASRFWEICWCWSRGNVLEHICHWHRLVDTTAHGNSGRRRWTTHGGRRLRAAVLHWRSLLYIDIHYRYSHSIWLFWYVRAVYCNLISFVSSAFVHRTMVAPAGSLTMEVVPVRCCTITQRNATTRMKGDCVRIIRSLGRGPPRSCMVVVVR